MKILILISLLAFLNLTLFSCKKENTIERLEDRLEEKSEVLEERAEDIEEASDHIGSAAKNVEKAMEHFRKALEEVDDPNDRKMIKMRINSIIDSIEIKHVH